MTGMKMTIERHNCVGHARCHTIAPEVFELDDVGYIASLDGDIPEALEDKAYKGARACPERVIHLSGSLGKEWPPAAG